MLEVWWPDWAERIRERCLCGFSVIWFGADIPPLARVVADAMEKDPAALEQAEADWRAGRAERKNYLYDGKVPGIPIDADHFGPNANVVSTPPVDIGLSAPPPVPPARSLGILDCDNLTH